MTSTARKIIAASEHQASGGVAPLKSTDHLAIAGRLAQHVSAHLDELNARLTSRCGNKEALLTQQEMALAAISSLSRIRGSFAPVITDNLRTHIDALIGWRMRQPDLSLAESELTATLQAALADADAVNFFKIARTTQIVPGR